MMINTDIMIPFMPRMQQPRVTPTRFTIKKIEKKTDLKSSADKEKQPDLLAWLMRHHDVQYTANGKLEGTASEEDEAKQKHIDILA